MLTITPVALAFAAEGAKSSTSGLVSFFPIAVLFVIFYFFLIRPQQKKAKDHKEMLSRLSKGDNVLTNGGIFGRISAVSEDSVTVEIADNVRVKMAKHAISKRKTKD
ncbi:MAG: preprotein translocase subunit YajC [Thermodesulfobacteriota bacterium]|nr:MAG: preprotein translocase subunit YajC [Thermodesulfobacteriota bacterium]